MANAKDMKRDFWEKLESDMTMRLGIANVENGHCRP